LRWGLDRPNQIDFAQENCGFGASIFRQRPHGMISSRPPVAPQSALLCANAARQVIDSVTRVSSRVELVESEFNGTGVSLPYIKHQVSASDAASR
jgi:hypothetical protein